MTEEERKEKKREKGKEYYCRTKESRREKRLEQTRLWRQKNKAHISKYNREDGLKRREPKRIEKEREYEDAVRAFNKGLPANTVAIPLNTVNRVSKNYLKYYTLIDVNDYQRVSAHKWSVCHPGGGDYSRYAQSRYKGEAILLHNFVTGKLYVDHIDGDGLNNRGDNLRESSPSENNRNSRKLSKSSTSIYKGVYWNSQARKWEAKIGFNKKYYYLGRFTSEEEAALAYNEKAKELFGEFARLNVVE